MDTKLTLSFDKEVIEKAKGFAEANGLSLSRLVEYLLRKSTSREYKSIEDFPVSEWLMTLMEGPVTYTTKPRSNKELRAEAQEYKKASKNNSQA
ncbi:MAG: hypothetical protein JST06_06330 [Bacteroidetes bacterium]|nr:hypothetical protein [Bacteroidota bacterium]MBS1629213.1 hypothetical protein [Bacteroidota bacterium]